MRGDQGQGRSRGRVSAVHAARARGARAGPARARVRRLRAPCQDRDRVLTRDGPRRDRPHRGPAGDARHHALADRSPGPIPPWRKRSTTGSWGCRSRRTKSGGRTARRWRALSCTSKSRDRVGGGSRSRVAPADFSGRRSELPRPQRPRGCQQTTFAGLSSYRSVVAATTLYVRRE